MSDKSENLWPDDVVEVSGPKAPAAILREQGSLLGKKTQNLVLGRVVAEQEEGPKTGHYVRPSPTRGTGAQGPTPIFVYAFYLVAPALDNYHYKLFTMKHGIKLYPVMVQCPNVKLRRPGARTQEEFLAILREIFASEHTRQVIESLLAQSQAPV